MESRKLEIVLHYAEDLDDVKFFGTMDPYALVWIATPDGDKASVQLKTSVAENAGPNPVWITYMEFEVGSMNDDYILICQIKHDGTLFDRDIGEARVPFNDLLAGNALGEKVSYPVKIFTGEVQGKIILSHKFLKPVAFSVGNSGAFVGPKLEIVLHYAEDLFDVKMFRTMNPYALIWITNDRGGLVSKVYKTSVAKKAGRNPFWESHMQFDVGSTDKSYNLVCHIKHDGTLIDQHVGIVEVPFKRLLAKKAPKERARYTLIIAPGIRRFRGKITLSHMFSDPMSSGTPGTKNRKRRKKVPGTAEAKFAHAMIHVNLEEHHEYEDVEQDDDGDGDGDGLGDDCNYDCDYDGGYDCDFDGGYDCDNDCDFGGCD